MSTLTLILSVLALLFVLILWGRASAQGMRLDDLETEVRRNAAGGREQQARELETLKQLMMRVAAGESVSADMIEEGRTWDEIRAGTALAMAADANSLTIDVRTPAECAGGVIPGALRIPIEEIEERFGEIPNDGRDKLICCAMGVRSAAVCDFLSQKGYSKLHNLEGGMSSWSGPIERG